MDHFFLQQKWCNLKQLDIKEDRKSISINQIFVKVFQNHSSAIRTAGFILMELNMLIRVKEIER